MKPMNAAAVQRDAEGRGRERRPGLHRQDDHPPQRQHHGRHDTLGAAAATTNVDALAGQRRHLRQATAPALRHGAVPDERRLRRGDRLRQRLRQRHLQPSLDDRGRQRRDHRAATAASCRAVADRGARPPATTGHARPDRQQLRARRPPRHRARSCQHRHGLPPTPMRRRDDRGGDPRRSTHSFIVDNYDCGAKLGNLDVNGAIAQKYRGAVGTERLGGTGFLKNYWYDDRLPLPLAAVLPQPGRLPPGTSCARTSRSRRAERRRSAHLQGADPALRVEQDQRIRSAASGQQLEARRGSPARRLDVELPERDRVAHVALDGDRTQVADARRDRRAACPGSAESVCVDVRMLAAVARAAGRRRGSARADRGCGNAAGNGGARVPARAPSDRAARRTAGSSGGSSRVRG